VNLPGRDRRITEPLIPNIRQLAVAAAEGLWRLCQGRFAFFGHSMGALVGFELSRTLRRQGSVTPVCLAVSGFGAPHLASIRRPAAHLPDTDFLEELRRLEGTPPGVLDNPELLELLLPLLRADFSAVETYQFVPEMPLSCAILAYGGNGDAEVPLEQVEGWSVHTTGSFRMRSFEGNHFYLQARRRELLEHLAADLLLIAGLR
jgi:medium-chain acyl-[acyl-carrier-protein] hydrolase